VHKCRCTGVLFEQLPAQACAYVRRGGGACVLLIPRACINKSAQTNHAHAPLHKHASAYLHQQIETWDLTCEPASPLPNRHCASIQSWLLGLDCKLTGQNAVVGQASKQRLKAIRKRQKPARQCMQVGWPTVLHCCTCAAVD